MEQNQTAKTPSSPASPADERAARRAAEVDEVARMFEENRDGDGNDTTTDTSDSTSEAHTPQSDGDGKTPKSKGKEIELLDGKAELPDEQAPPAKQFKALRRLRSQVEQGAAQLAQQKVVIEQNRRALEARAREQDGSLQKAKQITDALERLKSGDVEAATVLGLDIEQLNTAWLRHQTGDARLERLERDWKTTREKESKEREEREAKAREEEQRKQKETTRAELQAEVVQAAKTSTKLLAHLKPEQQLWNTEAVAAEWNEQGRQGTYTVEEAVAEAEKRLLAVAKDWSSALGYQPPPGTTPEETLSKRDAGRGSPRKAPRSKQEELDEIAAMFDSLAFSSTGGGLVLI